MRIVRIYLAQLFLLSSFCLAQYEEFNFNDGRSLQARIVEANDKEVVLERVDGLTFTLDVSLFVPEDQTMITDWRYQQLVASGKFIAISGKANTDNLKKLVEEGLVQKQWDTYFTLTLTNTSSLPAEDLVLEYQFITTHDSLARLQGREEPKRADVTSGSLENIDLAPGETKSFTTQKKQLDATYLEEGWTWPGGGAQPVEDFTSPLSCKLFFRGEMIAQLQVKPVAPGREKAKSETPLATGKEADTNE